MADPIKPEYWAKVEFPRQTFGPVELGQMVNYKFLDVTRKVQTRKRNGEIYFFYVAKVYEHPDQRGLKNMLKALINRGDLKITWYEEI